MCHSTYALMALTCELYLLPLLPIEWFDEVFRLAVMWVVHLLWRYEKSTKHYHLEEGEVITKKILLKNNLENLKSILKKRN